MSEYTQTAYGFICDECGAEITIPSVHRAFTVNFLKSKGWTFGQQGACWCSVDCWCKTANRNAAGISTLLANLKADVESGNL